jgi:hypothetical protein
VVFRLDEAGIALLKVGDEAPGVLLRLEEDLGYRPPPWPGPRVWLEVRDARATARALVAAEVPVLEEPFAVATGWTSPIASRAWEVPPSVADPWGNVVGFTNYSKRPELGRS